MTLEPESVCSIPPDTAAPQIGIPDAARVPVVAPAAGKSATKVTQQKAPRKRGGIGPWLDFKIQRKHRERQPKSLGEWISRQREFQGRPSLIQWDSIEFDEGPIDPFKSSPPEADYCFDVCEMVRRGRLGHRSVIIPESITKHLHPFDERLPRRRNESEDHINLKLTGIAWLRSIGAQRVSTEIICPYGAADVYSLDLGVAVECGGTPAERVMSVLDGNPVAMLVLPYCSRDERGSIGGFFWHPSIRPAAGGFEHAR